MGTRGLLVSDLDGTLLGDDEALEEFADWYHDQRHWLTLVYASGRFCHSIADAIASSRLPEPQAIVGGVGTQIEFWPARRPSNSWQQRLHSNFDGDRVRQVLAGHPPLEPQPEEFQSRLKASYYFANATPIDLTAIQSKLMRASVCADIIYSSERDLDVIPKGANKGSAAAFLADTWDYHPAAVMVAGDSGNDLTLYEQSFLGIVPANAHPELCSLDNARVYHSRRGFAGGVLDGIRYWMGSGLS